jgi:hypothetical protein
MKLLKIIKARTIAKNSHANIKNLKLFVNIFFKSSIVRIKNTPPEPSDSVFTISCSLSPLIFF